MKFRFAVTFVVLVTMSATAAEYPKRIQSGVQLIGRIQSPRIRESSGLFASRQFANIFWTHNDHGNAATLYAIDGHGISKGEFAVEGAKLIDWEDLSGDDHGHLYLADTGNNHGKRTELFIHQISEPDPAGRKASVPITKTWTLRFPEVPFDCESLFIWRTNGYVISKVFEDAPAKIYSFKLSGKNEPVVLQFVAETKITSPVTGADISRDGSLLGIVAKSGASVFCISGNVDSISSAVGERVKFKGAHIEACAFVSEGLMATAESGEIYLFDAPQFIPKK